MLRRGVFERDGEESKPEFETNRGTPMSRGKRTRFIGLMLLPLRAERGTSSRQRHDLERGTSSIMTSRHASSWNDILRDIHKNLERNTVQLSVCAFLHQQQLEPLDDSTLLATTSAQARRHLQTQLPLISVPITKSSSRRTLEWNKNT